MAGLGYRDVEGHETLRAVEVTVAVWANGGKVTRESEGRVTGRAPAH